MTVKPLGSATLVPIGSIKPYGDNPRKISPKAIEMTAASIKEFGWQQPIVVDRGGVIVAGHTRWKAAKSLKLRKVPVIYADLTEDQARAFRIADNRTSDFTTWDFPTLLAELDALPDFTEVLGVADWEAIVAAASDVNADLDLSPLAGQTVQDDPERRLTVVFESIEARDKHEAALFALEGVIDVRRSLS